MDRTKDVPEGSEDLTELDQSSFSIAADMFDAREGVEQAISSAVRTLEPSSFEPIVRKASDEIYALIMEGCQDYLRDNAEFNIGSHIDMLERERKFEREKVEALTAEIADLRAEVDALAHDNEQLMKAANHEANLAEDLRAQLDEAMEAVRLFPAAYDVLSNAEMRDAKGNLRSLIDQQANALAGLRAILAKRKQP